MYSFLESDGNVSIEVVSNGTATFDYEVGMSVSGLSATGNHL